MKGSVLTEAYKRTPVLQNLPIAASSAKSCDSGSSITIQIVAAAARTSDNVLVYYRLIMSAVSSIK